MKIAVISDLHANPIAFDEVLKDIEKFNPDMIFCLGDLILAGYDPNKTCEKIFELKDKFKENFKIIQGNTDKMIAFCNEEIIKKTKEVFPCMGYSLEQDVKITNEKYIDFVKNLPEELTVEIENVKIHLVHGSPRAQNENIYPELTTETVEEIVKKSPCDLILCGHTHLPCGYSLNSGKTVINVGSVGRSMTKEKMPVYLRLTIDKDGKFLAEHRIIKYDNKKAADLILKRSFKHCEDLKDMYV